MDEDEQLEAHQRERDSLLAEEVARLRNLQAVSDDLIEQVESAKAKICVMLDERGEKSASVALGDSVYRVTVVAGERVKVNEDGLKKAIGARAWNHITVRKVSSNLLREAITTGSISAAVAAEFVEIKQNKVFPKITITAKVAE